MIRERTGGRFDMASKQKSQDMNGESPSRKTQKVNVWLSPDQVEFLKSDKGGPSAAVRALITEALNMQNLARSVKSGAKKRTRK